MNDLNVTVTRIAFPEERRCYYLLTYDDMYNVSTRSGYMDSQEYRHHPDLHEMIHEYFRHKPGEWLTIGKLKFHLSPEDREFVRDIVLSCFNL